MCIYLLLSCFEINLISPEHVKGGVFSSAYIQYTVKTAPFGWHVKRRFTDFFWLRDTLKKLHPGVFVRSSILIL